MRTAFLGWFAFLGLLGCNFIDDFGRFTFDEDAAVALDADIDGGHTTDGAMDAHDATIDSGIADAAICEDRCSEGQTECRGTHIVTCGVSLTGCLDWGPELMCQTPPPVECIDDVLRSTPSSGVCASDVCVYASQIDITCSHGCAGRSCTLELDLYAKASNADPEDLFGVAVAISADGTTMAVGASEEASVGRGVDADPTNNTGDRNGAVYVFRRSAGGSWIQEAYIKASNTSNADYFGEAVALSADGSTLVVGAWGESSSARGINGERDNDDAMWSGAVFVFERAADGRWSEEAFIKASNADPDDRFGSAVAISHDGTVLAVGAWGEDSAAGGVNGNQDSNTLRQSGAVYLFRRGASETWNQEAYFKASNPDPGDNFGWSLALSGDGAMLAVGAWNESSPARGIDGDQNNGQLDTGAVYVFRAIASDWMQEAYVKASNTDAGDGFGYSVSLSADGTVLAVGARFEDSTARGIGGDESMNSAAGSNTGAVYVFRRSAETWAQEAYVKSSNPRATDRFGWSVSLSPDGTRLAVGSPFEDSAARGTGGDQESSAATDSGAVYLFRWSSGWVQEAYVKASNTDANDEFGCAVALSSDVLVVGARKEDSGARGIDGDQTSNSSRDSGAVYVYR